MKTMGETSGQVSGPFYQKARIQMFSDNILITVQGTNHPAFATILSHVMLLQTSLIVNGFLLRGAIVSGAHYEKELVMFGPALIKAVNLEKLANWPRVVVDADVINSLGTPTSDIVAAAKEYLNRDHDGLLFLDYLRGTYVVLKEIEWAIEYIHGSLNDLSNDSPSAYHFITMDHIQEHRQTIERSVNPEKAERPNTDVLTKYHALAEYHNATVDTICNALDNASKVMQSQPRVELNKLRHFTLPMFAGLVNSEGDKVVEFVRKKLAKPKQMVSLLEASKIDLKGNFPEFY